MMKLLAFSETSLYAVDVSSFWLAQSMTMTFRLSQLLLSYLGVHISSHRQSWSVQLFPSYALQSTTTYLISGSSLAHAHPLSNRYSSTSTVFLLLFPILKGTFSS